LSVKFGSPRIPSRTAGIIEAEVRGLVIKKYPYFADQHARTRSNGRRVSKYLPKTFSSK
jgi:acyl-CoA hydrolase